MGITVSVTLLALTILIAFFAGMIAPFALFVYFVWRIEV